MGEFARGMMIGLSGVLGLAIIAVLVSQKAQTAGVIGSAAGGLATVINAAVSPVTGGAGGGGPSSVSSDLGLSSSTGENFYLPNLPGIGTAY